MKAIFLKDGNEITLNIDGEKWAQGDELKGELISNQSFDLHLCSAQKKKVKLSDPNAFKLISTISLNIDDSSFSFGLDRNILVSDVSTGLYLVVGSLESPFDIGFLEFPVTCSNPVTYIIQILEQFLKFKTKPFKNKKGCIESVVTPPSAKEWTSIQKASLQTFMNEEDLHLAFIMKVKKMSYAIDNIGTKDEKEELRVVLTKKDYELYGSINQDKILSVLDEILAKVKVRSLK